MISGESTPVRLSMIEKKEAINIIEEEREATIDNHY
jgi:hypothetical protein